MRIDSTIRTPESNGQEAGNIFDAVLRAAQKQHGLVMDRLFSLECGCHKKKFIFQTTKGFPIGHRLSFA